MITSVLIQKPRTGFQGVLPNSREEHVSSSHGIQAGADTSVLLSGWVV